MKNFTKYLRAVLCLMLTTLAASSISADEVEHTSPPIKQKIEISGIIIDSDKIPLIGVNVIVKGTSIGTSTDIDGRFVLDNVDEDATLLITYIGYETKEVILEGDREITITLLTNTEVLDEVVVVGYGTVKKSDVTGSVSSVKVDELREGVVSSVDQLLIGKSSGVSVVQGSGEPGAGFSLNIRGSSSINAGNDPLYVIDGIPIDNDRPITRNGIGVGNSRTPRSPMASLNPGDIESIEILKDASATAIYGSRGANGVILITTKQGSAGKPKFNYNTSLGVQNWSNELDLLSAEDYRRVLNDIVDAGGAEEAFRISNTGVATDWQKEVANKNAFIQNHQLSVSGGNDVTKYYASVNMIDQDGIIRNSGYKRLGGRLNLQTDLTDKLEMGVKLVHSYSDNNFVANGAAAIEDAGVLQATYTYDPTFPVRGEDGSFIRNELISVDNPVALAEGIDSRSDVNRTFISGYLQYNLTDNLFFKSNFGRDITFENRKSFASDITRVGEQNNGIGTIQNSELEHYLIDGSINYSYSVDNHAINAVGAVNYERSVSLYQFTRSSDFPSLALGADNLGLGSKDNYELGNNKTGNRLSSFLGRVNYTLSDKYLFTVSARLDGSSRFGANNKYGFFPSGAFGWKISEEDFLKNASVIDNLKLRLSWGQSGNQEIGNYPSLSSYSQGQIAAFDGTAVTTTRPTRIPNPELKWETTEQINIGVDFGLWEGRVQGTLDYFQKRTTDMLLNLPIATSTGFNTQLSNVGEILNTGFEASFLTTNVNSAGFKWSSILNLATIKNEVVSLGPVEEIILGGAPTWGGGVGIITPGQPMNSFIGWDVDGVWQEGDDFTGTNENVVPGDIKFTDQNGDGSITDADRVILGNSFPDLQLSLGNTFEFGPLHLFVFFEGVSGMSMLNTKMVESFYPINFRRNKIAEPYLNRWTPQNPTNEYPSFVNPTNQGVRSVNAWTVEDASYIKLRTIRLSYDFNTTGKRIDGVQVYVTGENLLTWTDYSGIDPALNSNGNANYRIDLNPYPTASTILFGLNVDF